ncbi:MAG TPA: bifunctional demethylmenaquinone methyltransferase/2-methoxy-6-polyprenyl-1,4-benzoquinol methylase UbiE [Candidatus Eremiobacteraceae bacterium]|nr:bifunctional demethylmenaquinone methyltransferase/2-methoxy-6-polyprenyl-1,4-benzoquinol methylase UbiE [Candidatus Eremiobacteraceae bacterium]
MDKGGGVREMFGRIAGRYDLVNTVMTGGVDAIWRRKAVACLSVSSDAHLIDLCCGTGALTRDLAKRASAGSVVGIDFTPQMLEIARAHTAEKNVEYREGDVLSLPFGDSSFDGATMGFSMRNVVDIGACLREVARVLKPGASFVNLEVSKPRNPILRRAFYAYFYGMVPLIGRVVGGDAAAYRYLPQSLVNFPDADALAALFAANGFASVRYVPLVGGVVTLHVGTKAKAPIAGPTRAPEAVAP